MKLYLDTADSAEWRLPVGCPRIDGVTTNPSLVHAAGLPVNLNSYHDLIARVADARIGELMLQLPDPSPAVVDVWVQSLLSRAGEFSVRLTIKLPCHRDWQGAIDIVKRSQASFLLTGVSNPIQLIWATQCGAHYVAPYIGRLQAAGREPWHFLQACVVLQAGGPRLLAASIKSADVLSRLIALGAYGATVRPEFAASLSTDVITDAALEQFDADAKASLQMNQPASQ